MDSSIFTSPMAINLMTAALVFLSIYILFFLMSVLADMVIVGIALSSAVIAYNIRGFYPDLLELLNNKGILQALGLNLSKQPDTWSVFVMATFIVLVAVVACLPFLPFSATYRQILGVEKQPVALSTVQELKIKQWIREEAERIQE